MERGVQILRSLSIEMNSELEAITIEKSNKQECVKDERKEKVMEKNQRCHRNTHLGTNKGLESLVIKL